MKGGCLYEDWVKAEDTVVALTQEDANFPAENVKTEEAAVTARTISGQITDIKLQMTFSTTRAPRIFALVNHNLAGGTIDINSYTAGDFTTGKTTIATIDVRELDVCHYAEEPTTARGYWEFDLTNATPFARGEYQEYSIEIGRAMLYSACDADLAVIEDFRRHHAHEFSNIVNETPWGARWVHNVESRREKIKLTWGARLGIAVRDELLALLDLTAGDARPFLMIPDLADSECFYGYATEPWISWVELWIDYSHENLSFEMETASRGLKKTNNYN
jgi:hypothetical protein